MMRNVRPSSLAHVVEGADVGVAEGGDGAGLALEALQPFALRGQLRRQELEGYSRASSRGVASAVDFTHPPGAQGARVISYGPRRVPATSVDAASLPDVGALRGEGYIRFTQTQMSPWSTRQEK